jgi:hypothetical protein
METLWVLVAGAALVMAFDFAMRLLRAWIIDLASRQVDLTLSARLMERVLGMSLHARPRSVGAFAANLRAFETVRDFIASTTATALIDLPFALLFLVVTLWIQPWMTLPPLLGFAAAIGYGFLVQRRMRELAGQTHQAGAQRNAVLVEGLVGLEAIKTLGAESQLQARWEQNTRHQAEIGSQLRLVAASATTFAGFVQQATVLSILVIGVYQIGNAALSMGGLIACVMLAGRAMAPLAQVAALLTHYHAARTALDGVTAAMELPLERAPERRFLHRPQLRGGIEFRNVSFTYPHAALPALQGVSLRIAPGEKVAIIGKVGSGKTTLEKNSSSACTRRAMARCWWTASTCASSTPRSCAATSATCRRTWSCSMARCATTSCSARRWRTTSSCWRRRSSPAWRASPARIRTATTCWWTSAAARSRAASARKSRWRARCCATRRCCCWTSPPAPWMPPPRRRSSSACATSRRTRPCCSSPTAARCWTSPTAW